MKSRMIGLLAVVLLLAPSGAQAQFSAFPEPAPLPEGLVSCFDHYAFGSIPVVAQGNTKTVAAGTTLTLSGMIKNQNAYPVSNLKVYAKLVRTDGGAAKSIQGPDVLAEFLVGDDSVFGTGYSMLGFTLTAGEEKTFPVTYTLPPYLKDGSYQVLFYVLSNDRFNMAGLSFTDDVVGGTYPFELVGGGEGSALFDRSSFTVAGRPHRFVAYPSKIFSNEGTVRIEGAIKNETKNAISGNLTWTLYYWDAKRKGQVLDTKTESLTVPGGGSVKVHYDLSNLDHSVYQLVGTFETSRGPSTIGVRVVREGVQEPRLNYVGFNQTDKGALAYACVHNTGSAPQIEDTTLTLKVMTRGFFTRTLLTKEYEGPVTSDISALIAPVSFLLPESVIYVQATLERGGKKIDSAIASYTCKQLGVCPLLSLEKVIVLLVLLCIGILGFLGFKRMKNTTTTPI